MIGGATRQLSSSSSSSLLRHSTVLIIRSLLHSRRPCTQPLAIMLVSTGIMPSSPACIPLHINKTNGPQWEASSLQVAKWQLVFVRLISFRVIKKVLDSDNSGSYLLYLSLSLLSIKLSSCLSAILFFTKLHPRRTITIAATSNTRSSTSTALHSAT